MDRRDCAGLLPSRSPRAWGWTGMPAALRALEIPTRVGMDRSRPEQQSRERKSPRAWGWTDVRVRQLTRSRGNPHARGDGPALPPGELMCRLKSPRAWGWTGFTWSWSWSWSRNPHARGDGPTPTWSGRMRLRRLKSPRAWGWTELRTSDRDADLESPRAWGWTDAGRALAQPEDEIPTRVGMDRYRRPAGRQRRRNPHARGDGPATARILLNTI